MQLNTLLSPLIKAFLHTEYCYCQYYSIDITLDILGLDILGLDILGLDILGYTLKGNRHEIFDLIFMAALHSTTSVTYVTSSFQLLVL